MGRPKSNAIYHAPPPIWVVFRTDFHISVTKGVVMRWDFPNFVPYIINKKRNSISFFYLLMVICMGFGPMYVTLRGLCVKPLHQQTSRYKYTNKY